MYSCLRVSSSGERKKLQSLGKWLSVRRSRGFGSCQYPAASARCLSTNSDSHELSKDALPERADAVVIGGGAVGTSVLYHLQARGLNAVLLERSALTSGTTWHSAGMLWKLRPHYVDMELHAYTYDLINRMTKDLGIDVYHENGGLFIACTRERMDEYQRLAETGRYYNVENHVLDPSETKKVHPLINTSDIIGSVYSPTDGSIDPANLVNAFAKSAKNLGAQIFENVPVSKISYDSVNAGGHLVKKMTGVVTADGHEIKTPIVVNASGAWGGDIAAMIEEKLPLLALKHAFVVTDKLEGMHANLPNVRDHDLSIYLKAQGDSLALGGYESNPEYWNSRGKEFSFGLFELDWDTFAGNLNGHIQRCPMVETAGIKSTVCGPESFTPDHKPLVGPGAGTRGYFNACGFNSMGIMLSGGIGKELATWIVEGSAEKDLFSFDSQRFHSDCINDFKWVKDTTHESYKKTYSIVFPHDEALAGRGARKSAFYKQLSDRGCFFQARHGFERPGWFVKDPEKGSLPLPYDYYGAYSGDGAWRLGFAEDGKTKYVDSSGVEPHVSDTYNDLTSMETTFDWPLNMEAVAEECRAAREGVAIFDQSYFGKFYLDGPDAKAAAQWVCTADIEKLEPGSVVYTTLCNARGGVEADLTVTHLPRENEGSPVYYFAAGGSTCSKDFEWLKKSIIDKNFDVNLRLASEDIAMLSVQGPHSRALLSRVIADADNILDAEKFGFSQARYVKIGGKDILCLRITFVGELGYELHIPQEHAPAVYSALRAVGDEYEAETGFPVRDAGYRAIDSLSAEKGYRHWHLDLANCDTPMEASIGFTVLSKLKNSTADFSGRTALEKHRAEGLQRKLVCLVMDEPQMPLHGMETIWKDGECLGVVRSTAYGYTIGKFIAYGYVKAPAGLKKITNNWLKEGKWQIGRIGKLHDAQLQVGAPFDSKSKRVMGDYSEELPSDPMARFQIPARLSS